MSIKLPIPISAYLAVDAKDGDAVARCFTVDAGFIAQLCR